MCLGIIWNPQKHQADSEGFNYINQSMDIYMNMSVCGM